MHLSLLSDAYLSDSLQDSNWPFVTSPPGAHFPRDRDGVVLGLIFIAALSIIVAIVTAAGIARSNVIEPGFAPFQTGIPAIGPSRYRSPPE